MFFNRSELCRGVHLNIINTNKFKKNFVNVNFVLPHKKEYAALSSVLADVLTRATKSFPHLRDVERELDECYGAQLSAFSSLKGESKIISVSMDSIGDCYALGSDKIFERSCRLLYEVLFSPYMENGAFSVEYVESEKDKLLASVGRRKNSKRHYALDSCKKNMCSNEPFGIPSYGSEEDIRAVTAQGLYDFYKYMLECASVELFFVGQEDEKKVKKIFSDMFGNIPRKSYLPQQYPTAVPAGEPKYICEQADYKQSVLVMGFRTNISRENEQKYAFSVFNAVFGSGVNSKLFKVVREKMHLCYYASCSPELAKGVAFVSSGIDSSNEKITKEAILAQLAATKRGDFTDEDISDCKKALENAYKELYDSPDGLCGWYLGRVVFGDTECAESDAKKIGEVTREQIMEVAEKMQLDTVFMLKGVAKECTPVSEEGEL